MTPKTIIHLLSGGLDSTTLLYDLHASGDKLHCVMADYGQKHVQELTFAKAHCSRLGVLFTTVCLPPLGMDEASWIVPNRNAILIGIATSIAVRAGAEHVTIGCNADDAAGFPDCRPEFISAMNAANKAAKIDVEVCAPYIAKKKWEIAGLARELGVPLNEIWTCYRGGERPCGECPACRKLECALS